MHSSVVTLLPPPGASWQHITSLNLSQWGYLAQGSYKVVFQNINPVSPLAAYVLLLEKKPVTRLDEHVTRHYVSDLAGTGLGEYMVREGRFVLTHPAEHAHIIEQFIRSHLKIGSYECPPNSLAQLTLAQNLFANEQDYRLICQLKIKTILPDMYAESTLAQVSGQLGMPVPEIKALLLNSDPIEKCKWFKSYLGFNKREQENSFGYYGVAGLLSTALPFGLTKKNIKYIRDRQELQMLEECLWGHLAKSELVRTIHSILKRVDLPKSALAADSQAIAEDTHLPALLQDLNTNVDLCEQYLSLEGECCHRVDAPGCPASLVYRYLVFVCVSDMSIIARVRSDLSIDYRVVDWKPIPLALLRNRFTKYHCLLERYIEHRLSAERYIEMKKEHGVGVRAMGELLECAQPQLIVSMHLHGVIQTDLQMFAKLDLSCLKLLDLDNNKIGSDGALHLSQTKCPHLHVLKLNYNKIGETGLVHLMAAGWKQLLHLEMNWNNIRQADWKAVWQLQVLQLAYNTIGHLGSCLDMLAGVQVLNLNHIFFSRAGMQCLCAASLPRLRAVSLSGNRISDAELVLIGRAPWPSLQFLDLSHNRLTLQAKQSLLSADSMRFKSLEQLKLGTNKIGVLGCETLAQICGRFPQLRVLDLFSNPLRDDGIVRLAQQTWPSLKQLNLCFCEIGDRGFNSINGGGFGDLSRLRLAHNKITSDPQGQRSELEKSASRVDLRGNPINSPVELQ